MKKDVIEKIVVSLMDVEESIEGVKRENLSGVRDKLKNLRCLVRDLIFKIDDRLEDWSESNLDGRKSLENFNGREYRDLIDDMVSVEDSLGEMRVGVKRLMEMRSEEERVDSENCEGGSLGMNDGSIDMYSMLCSVLERICGSKVVLRIGGNEFKKWDEE